jgi:hypothetical protein
MSTDDGNWSCNPIHAYGSMGTSAADCIRQAARCLALEVALLMRRHGIFRRLGIL